MHWNSRSTIFRAPLCALIEVLRELSSGKGQIYKFYKQIPNNVINYS